MDELPILKKLEVRASQLSLEELREGIEFSRERMAFYKDRFESSRIPAERDHFQKCCEYYISRVMVFEIAIEKITGLTN